MPFLALLGLWGVAELVALIAVVSKIGFFATLGLLILWPKPLAAMSPARVCTA